MPSAGAKDAILKTNINVLCLGRRARSLGKRELNLCALGGDV